MEHVEKPEASADLEKRVGCFPVAAFLKIIKLVRSVFENTFEEETEATAELSAPVDYESSWKVLDKELPSGVRVLAGGREGKITCEHQGVKVYASTKKGARSTNEDGVMVDAEGGKFALVDGVGGGAEGEWVSALFLYAWGLTRGLEDLYPMFRSLLGRVPSKDSSRTSSTTFSRITIQQPRETELTRLHFSHLGDSVPILIDVKQKKILHRGKVRKYEDQSKMGSLEGLPPEAVPEASRLLNTDHTLFDYLGVRDGELGQEGSVEKTEFECSAGMVALLLSDGIDGVVSSQELIDLFSTLPFEEACEAVEELAAKRWNYQRRYEVLIHRASDGKETHIKIAGTRDNKSIVALEVLKGEEL